MREFAKISRLNRRQFLISATAAAGFLSLIAGRADADAPALERSKQFEETFAKLTRGATPVANKITVDLPELADNGNFVPITMIVDSPMTDADYVKAIHLVSTANPVALVATFHLSPINAIARVQSRMRLAKTQDVIVLAELSSGQMLMSTTMVKVTIGGCGD
ncbi:thiosulfate-binding protein SoxY [Hyphomicrobium denitrificans 1NES1]|uniref:Thiosulfate-binding protein SoxY n=1 Tax=Hyphomicrobium denitrificans 1NES1 TaxID=670307 RepID=N0B728_9HYPH|nr:thiosulfate oxidation carrier protein SoxY [Hyphomicrobium denitrificans]AGK58007.1 thiosulfate-binding protein SoxY [Hyphomicrobium denitrificans 1NES1]